MLDIVVLILLIFAFFRGFRKGAIVAIFSLAGIVIGMIAALKLSGTLSQWLLEHDWVSSAWVQLISWLILFLGVVMLVRLGAKAIERLLKLSMLNGVNRVIGGLLYMFIAAFIWSCLLWLGNKAHLISPETMVISHTYSFLAPVAPFVFEKLGNILPFTKDLLESLSHFFDGVNKNLPGYVGFAG